MNEDARDSSGRKLAHDWYDAVIPDNVTFDSSNYIDTSYSFRRFRSRMEHALKLGRSAAIYANTMFDLGPNARVEMGAFSMLNGVAIICDEAIHIGDYGLISWNVVLMDNYRAPRSILKRRAYLHAMLSNDHSSLDLQECPRPITVGANVWIGHYSVVLPGVAIGTGSIVGARSVVSVSIPDFAIAVGNPARVIRYLEAPS
jgi:acetyltransferase-like isoleucine patch superfamily enzyme